MRHLSVALGAVLTASVVIPSAASGVLFLDQESDSTGIVGLLGGTLERAQTLTVGLDGQLGQLDLHLQRTAPGSTLFVDILLGVPANDNVLATLEIPAASIDARAWYSFNVSRFGLSFAPGTLLSLAMRSPDSPDRAYGWVGGESEGDCCGPYHPGGFSYFRGLSGPPEDWQRLASSDFSFRTWVVPEPSTALLVGVGLAGLGAGRRLRRARR